MYNDINSSLSNFIEFDVRLYYKGILSAALVWGLSKQNNRFGDAICVEILCYIFNAEFLSF